MVETSLSTARPCGTGAGAGAAGDHKKREKNPALGGVDDEGADGVWSTEEESQLVSLPGRGASAVAPGKTGREELDLSHASRVALSTGHFSSWDSGSLAMLAGY